MNKVSRNKISFLLLALSAAVALPHSVFASTVYVDTNHSEFFVGDTVLCSVRIDSENKDINTIEGEALLHYSENAASLTNMNTSGSPFSLWPRKPFPSEDNRAISFVGGAPGGLTSKDAIVFNVLLRLQKEGEIIISPNNIGVYLNDGKGTKDTVSVKNLTMNVLPKKSDAESPSDDWSVIISKDKKAPKSFEIIRGKDPSVFGNHYFISFFTTDEESGIAYYEAQEGDQEFVRAESPYLLQDQSLKSAIQVKAVDRAGNERIETWKPSTSAVLRNKKNLVWVISLLVAVSMLYAWRRFKRKLKV